MSLTGHKKRFCSFKTWIKDINIVKKMEYVYDAERKRQIPIR